MEISGFSISIYLSIYPEKDREESYFKGIEPEVFTKSNAKSYYMICKRLVC